MYCDKVVSMSGWMVALVVIWLVAPQTRAQVDQIQVSAQQLRDLQKSILEHKQVQDEKKLLSVAKLSQHIEGSNWLQQVQQMTPDWEWPIMILKQIIDPGIDQQLNNYKMTQAKAKSNFLARVRQLPGMANIDEDELEKAFPDLVNMDKQVLDQIVADEEKKQKRNQLQTGKKHHQDRHDEDIEEQQQGLMSFVTIGQWFLILALVTFLIFLLVYAFKPNKSKPKRTNKKRRRK